MKRKIEYHIRLVFRNYCGEVTESHLLAKAFCENIAKLIKETLEAQPIYSDANSGSKIEIIEMPRI